ncbi:cytochrome P450 [Streptomyces griseocarneus]|nr:cytochrome P450 [Streptomyces griseocarneus]
MPPTAPPPPPLRPVPGPGRLPLLGNLPAFGRDPMGFVIRLRDQFGDAVTWSLGPRRSLFLFRPEHIAELLGAVEHSFDILDIGWAFRQVAGESVLLSKGADWRRKRSLVQPTVRPRQVRAYAATMTDCAREAADGWREGQRIDVHREMALITQRVVVRTLFGNDLGDRTRGLGDAMEVAEREIGAELHSMALFLPGWVPTPARRRLRDAVAVIDAEVHRLIRERQASATTEGHGDDLLGRLLAAHDEQGQPLSAKEVRDEAVTLWAAGHETTSTLLTWTWYLLSAAPAARARLEAELDRELGGRPPHIDDYERLTWTRQIVKEALRVRPPVWLIPAVAREGAVLGGLPVPAGTIAWASPWATQRDPRWFPDPTAFRPERWDPDAPDAVPDHAWFPFGGGRRACLGARFALVEAALLLATVAQRHRLEIDPAEPETRVGLLLQPASPLRATVRSRG